MRILTASVIVIGWSGICFAQQRCGVTEQCYQQQQCVDQQCVERQCVQPCAPKRCCRPRQQAGMFAAPQGAGETAGESSSLGLRGFTFRFPAMNFGLPTVQFPSFVRYRRDAHMAMDSAVAPFVAGPAAAYAQVAPGGNAFAAAAQPLGAQPLAAESRSSASCDGSNSSNAQAEDADVDAQSQELEQLRGTLKQMLDCIERANVVPPAPAALEQEEDTRIRYRQLEERLQAKSNEVEQLQTQLDDVQGLCQQLLAKKASVIQQSREAELRRRLDHPELKTAQLEPAGRKEIVRVEYSDATPKVQTRRATARPMTAVARSPELQRSVAQPATPRKVTSRRSQQPSTNVRSNTQRVRRSVKTDDRKRTETRKGTLKSFFSRLRKKS